MFKHRNNHLFKLHFIVFIWGFTGIIGKLIDMDALPLVSYRMLIGSITLFLFIFFIKASLIISLKNIFIFLAIGILLGIHWLSFFISIKTSNVSIALSMFSTGAVFAAFLEPMLFKRKIRLLEVILSLLVAICIFWIFKTEYNFLEGILWGLLAAFTSALLTILNAKVHTYNDNNVIMFYELLGGFLAVTLFAITTQDISNFYIKGEDWGWLLLLSIVLTAYPMVESVKLMRNISPFMLVLSNNLEPVYAILLAFFIFNDGSEYMSFSFYIATAVIIFTVIIHGYINNRHHTKSVPGMPN